MLSISESVLTVVNPVIALIVALFPSKDIMLRTSVRSAAVIYMTTRHKTRF